MSGVSVTVQKFSGLRWPQRQWTWPDSRRTLLLGVNPVTAHALKSSFMDVQPDTLRVVESSAAGGGEEWLNFSSQVISCGQPSNRLRVWDSLHDRLHHPPAALVFTLSALTPLTAPRVIEQACAVTEVLVDAPAGPMARHLSTLSWDAVAFEPYRLNAEDVTAAAHAARRICPRSPDLPHLRRLRAGQVLLITAAGAWQVR